MMGARRARHRRKTVVIAFAIAAVAVLLPALAFAHIERASYWPNPGPDTSVKPAAGGSVPAVRKIFSALDKKKPGKTRVVCAQMPSKKLKKHGTTKQLSKNKSIKALNKDLKKAQKKGYKIRASQPAIKIKKKKAKKLREASTSSCSASASTPRSRPRSPPPTTTTASRSCPASTPSRSRGSSRPTIRPAPSTRSPTTRTRPARSPTPTSGTARTTRT